MHLFLGAWKEKRMVKIKRGKTKTGPSVQITIWRGVAKE